MAKERLKSPRARLFVALDLPDDVRDALVAWQRDALRDPALRPVSPAALHITLAFLGYHPERRIEEISNLVTDTAAPVAPRLELLAEPVQRPPRGKARLYALEARSERAIELQAELASRLEGAGFYEPEKRPVWPHITVARVRSEKGSRRPRVVEKPPESLPESVERVFDAVRLTLYRSNLRRESAEYIPLAAKEL
jgi:2'-5' RNA ligase